MIDLSRLNLHLNPSWQELSVPGSHKHPMVLEGPALPSLHGWRFWTRPDPGIAAGDGLAGEAAPSGRASERASLDTCTLIHPGKGWHSQDGGGNACASKEDAGVGESGRPIPRWLPVGGAAEKMRDVVEHPQPPQLTAGVRKVQE